MSTRRRRCRRASTCRSSAERAGVGHREDPRERLIAFVHATDRSAAGDVAPVAGLEDDGRDSGARAWAITDDARPLVRDANHLYVEAAGGASAKRSRGPPSAPLACARTEAS